MPAQNTLVSFLIFSYNHSAFIEDAIESAFNQTYSPLEIVISDDASTDDTPHKIKALIDKYEGNHQVKFFRNPANLGFANHINFVLPICSGEWIVVAAGDDVSEPNRTKSIMDVAFADSSIRLIQSYLYIIDRCGDTIGIEILNDLCDAGEKNTHRVVRWGWTERLSGKSPATHGATFAYSKELLKSFNKPLDRKVIFEDNIFNWRAELSNGIALIREPLVRYRKHDAQTTNLNNKDISEVRRKRRATLESDVATIKHNIEDLDVAVSCNLVDPSDRLRIENWLLGRKKFFALRRDALLKRWPTRLVYLIRALSIQPSPIRWRRSEIIDAILPKLISKFIRKLRIRLHIH